jgi:AraC family transcriptional regulator
MRPSTEQTYRERVLRVLVYIQGHLDEALSLDDLAAVAHFSPYHFHRVFRGLVGESVMEHVRRLRLERAAHRLKSGDEPVTRIAFEAGYETHEAFTRAFGAMFGAAPSHFRQTRRWPAWAKVPSGVHYHPGGGPDRFQPLQPGGQTVDVRIQSVPVLRVAFMRHTGPYQDVKHTWERLMAWAGPQGLLGPHTRVLAVPHDDPDVTPPDKVRYDACIVVDDRFRPEGEVGVQQVGGGEYAVATHRGPYREVGQAFVRLTQWLPGSGRELRSSPPLLIPQGDFQAPNPEDVVIDVCLPLEPAHA